MGKKQSGVVAKEEIEQRVRELARVSLTRCFALLSKSRIELIRVFCKENGQPINPDVLRKDVFYPVLDRLRISRPKRSAGFHAFRHTAASLINDRTGNLKLA